MLSNLYCRFKSFLSNIAGCAQMDTPPQAFLVKANVFMLMSK